jgi:hypothetical protein
MDGKSPPNDLEMTHARIIEGWISDTIGGDGIERFDSLHVDRVDKAWKSPDLWVEAGLDAYRIALQIRDRLGLDVTVVLAFALLAEQQPYAVDFATIADLRKKLSWTPPSLYLFRPGTEFWTQRPCEDSPVSDVSVRALPVDLLPMTAPARYCYYMEFKQIDTGEYSRSVLVGG